MASAVRWASPPAFLVAIAAIVGAVGIGITAVGSQTGGISTDEPIHVRRLNHYLDSGYYVRNFEINHTPRGQIPTGAYVYAPVTSLIQFQVNRVLDYESLPHAHTQPRNYAARHAVIATMATAAILAVAAIGWLLLGSWAWGVMAGAMLAAMPLWTGHGMFNVKDTPVATGHTFLTLGLIALALSRPEAKLRPLVLGGAALTGGTVLMLGTRPGMWPSLVASLVVFGIIAVRARSEWTPPHFRRVIVTAGIAVAASYGALLAVYPRVFSTPFKTMKLSAFASADYTCRGECPVIGRDYALLHLLSDLPLGLLGLSVIGTVAAVVLLLVQRRRSIPLDCLALVGTQAFALIAAAVVLHSHLYHGLRQLLFSLPAIAVLAAVGLAVLFTVSKTPLQRRLLAVAGAAALILPTAVQFAMFPYQYTYVNVAAEQTGSFGVPVDNDYYRTSFREYVRTGPRDVKVTCPFLRYGGTPKRAGVDCRTQGAGTFSAYWRHLPAPDRPKAGEFYALIHGARPAPPNCEVYRQVRRWRNLESVVISQMFTCHNPTRAEILAGRAEIVRHRAKAKLPPRHFRELPPEVASS